MIFSRGKDGKSENLSEAFKWFECAAINEIKPAQNELALCYFNGLGVLPNKELGSFWSQKANA